ncbi:MAG: undecaprenyl/decaprenyl-phosphate alpha-N-acetylglucosaminyl 1-phosphate transferase [Deltaproteobacteria bacterium]|nr:undecaprenyl/decaprenyl-phosphate alpha-N-acetylglucosaminyl 1-phosphate transferase [Deltaproteobacteria bacterium]
MQMLRIGFLSECFFSFILAIGLSLYLTPIVIEAALKYDIVDRPDGKLKNHDRPTAYLGGLAVYLAFLFTLALTFDFSSDVLGILLAGSMLVMLGVIDDLRPLGPGLKLLGQAVAVLVLMRAGLYIKIAVLPPGIALVLTFFWLMATINAFNIIDIMDGLASGVACIASAVLFIVAVINRQTMMSILTVSLCGALIGFLRYNKRPARIYLGDAGSMLLGLTLGALAMMGHYSERNPVGYFAPLLILGVPLFDTAYVMFLRWRKGIPVIQGSPDHFALRLRRAGCSVRATVLLSSGAGCLLGMLGLACMFAKSSGAAIAIIGAAVVALVVFGMRLARIDMAPQE